MNGSRHNANSRGERTSLDALNRTIENLEARIEGLMHGAPADDIDRRAASPRRPHQDSPLLQEIRERQRLLDSSREPQRPTREQQRQISERLTAAETARPDPRTAVFRNPSPAAPATRNERVDAVDLSGITATLRNEISATISREIQSLRDYVKSAPARSADPHFEDDIRHELSRLSERVDALGGQTSGAPGELRKELHRLQQQIAGLNQDTVLKQLEQRWDDLETRLQDIDTSGIRQELIALAYRIDGVKAELGSISNSPAILALEDRLLSLAQTVEALGSRAIPTDLFAEQFSQIDYRLEEISRTIANSPRHRSDGSEQVLIHRIEDRLDIIASQVDAMARAAASLSAQDLASRVEALTDKVELLADAQHTGRVEEQLEGLTELLHRGVNVRPQAEVTGFLSDISRKIDALETGSVSDVLADRLDYLSRRIDELDHVSDRQHSTESAHLERLTTRLDDIAARLDDAVASPQADNRAIRDLEQQIANLSTLLSSSEPMTATLPRALDERMAAIESYISTSDEYVLEAARHAAETVVEAYGRGGHSSQATPDISAILGLADDLRHLEALTRGSEERTQQTFDSLHRTMVQIAERLDRMETGTGRSSISQRPLLDEAGYEPATVRPPMAAPETRSRAVQQEPAPRVLEKTTEALMSNTAPPIEMAEAAEADIASVQEPQRKSLLGALTKRLIPTQKQDARQTSPSPRTVVSPAPALDPADTLSDGHENDLLEPGSGVPDVRKILERVRASQTGGTGQSRGMDEERVDYIAAARRAAKAAAQETAPSQAQPIRVPKADAKGGSKSLLARHQRPILMAVGAILLALLAMPLVNTLTGSDRPQPSSTTAQTDSTSKGLEATGKADKVPGANPPAYTTTSDGPKSQTAAPTTQPPVTSTAAPLPATNGALDSDSVSVGADTVSAAPVAPVTAAPVAAAATAPATAKSTIPVPAEITPKALADAAANGDPQALFEIGSRYTEGRGVTADPKQAANWYRLAADRGLAPAQYRLGGLYEKGTGVERDLKKAMALYEQAARAGNASAMHNLAVLYASGAQGTPDYKNAMEWFEKAAELGVTDSQFNLAILYARGNGATQNLEESYKWFAIAAKGGDKDAGQKRDEVANALKPDQLKAAREKAESWKPQPLDPKSNTISSAEAWGDKTQNASVDMGKAIRNIQAILNRKGYDAGQPDGMMGKKTVQAIKAFQRKNGLPDDGNVTEALVRKLLEQNGPKGA
ncbi:peptidoglycan-binding protein [Rhizobium oryzicola]|uniref:Peptidoglycan-binding protein n=1 Tax=Rhizobium oryzicola TaxID=1232668 RepID=A0ABT8SR81_9HYPH|nr:peptidoglycan-binding protein [Rhizobium oryzicola]MDO1580933.1 peptidoglycan-binding protein [Rhizobium oryzicola]